MPQLTSEDAGVLMNFLNRVEFRGHVERNSMNILAAKLHMIMNPPPTEDTNDGKEDITEEIPEHPREKA